MPASAYGPVAVFSFFRIAFSAFFATRSSTVVAMCFAVGKVKSGRRCPIKAAVLGSSSHVGGRSQSIIIFSVASSNCCRSLTTVWSSRPFSRVNSRPRFASFRSAGPLSEALLFSRLWLRSILV